MNLKLSSVLILLLFFSAFTSAQVGRKVPPPKLGANPIMFIDSMRVSQADLQYYNPESISSVTVLTDSLVKASYGPGNKDGVVLIETKVFARKKFVSFLRTASSKYDSLYTDQGDDSSFCYILNDKPQKSYSEDEPFHLEKSRFISLDILTKDDLTKRFGVDNKKYGILIQAKDRDYGNEKMEIY